MKTFPRIIFIRGEWDSIPPSEPDAYSKIGAWACFGGRSLKGGRDFWEVESDPHLPREGPDIYIFLDTYLHRFPPRMVVPILAHELCHWGQWLWQGKPTCLDEFCNHWGGRTGVEKIPARLTIVLMKILFIPDIPVHFYRDAEWGRFSPVNIATIKEDTCLRSSGNPSLGV